LRTPRVVRRQIPVFTIMRIPARQRRLTRRWRSCPASFELRADRKPQPEHGKTKGAGPARAFQRQRDADVRGSLSRPRSGSPTGRPRCPRCRPDRRR